LFFHKLSVYKSDLLILDIGQPLLITDNNNKILQFCFIIYLNILSLI